MKKNNGEVNAVGLEQQSVFEILNLIEKHRQTAYRKINEQLVSLYFEIGKYLSEKIENQPWGAKAIQLIASEVKLKYPTMKGFNRPGLYRMIQFYECYRDNVIVSSLLRQISWTNHLLILSGTKSIEEKEFYMRLCVKNNYSSRELNRQIRSGYYQRYLLSNCNALESTKKRIEEDDIPESRILDCHCFEFLDLPNNYSEKDLRKAIVSNLKQFLLEMGGDFAFVGEEYRIQVGSRDFYIDLLLFDRKHSCLVAIELKIEEFQPEYVSKMNFYLEALDRQVRLPHENPSIGIILCTSKDSTVVEYTLSRSLSPTMISEFSTELIDKKLLEQKVTAIYKMLKK